METDMNTNTESKHTQGPWRTNGCTVEVANAWALRIAGAVPPSTLNGYAPKSLDEAKANARLIAAAPEMLEALATLIGCAETDGMDGKSNVWRSAMIDARAAIAKATGVES